MTLTFRLRIKKKSKAFPYYSVVAGKPVAALLQLPNKHSCEKAFSCCISTPVEIEGGKA
jgi:hypothetical protein